MNGKERLRKAIFEMVKQRRITLSQASIQCELSYRQTLRIYAEYLKKGDAGLIHQNPMVKANQGKLDRSHLIQLSVERSLCICGRVLRTSLRPNGTCA